ncbi:MAG: hypothetical protein IPP78_06420 [Holophagaceae bacterium]|nr:hypothetical protein [Holophagaceae bacterium]
MIKRALSLLRGALPLLALLSLCSMATPSLRADCRPKRVAPSAIPAYAWDTLDYVRSHHAAPPGFQGGRYFGNYGSNGETKLPMEARGQRISYQEWDVRRKRDGRSRGAERIVTGSDGRAWYTADHYCTFTEMK